MELKEYQTKALGAFEKWRDALGVAEAKSKTAVAALESVGAEVPGEVRNWPKSAWEKLVESGDAAAGAGRYAERTGANGAAIRISVSRCLPAGAKHCWRRRRWNG